MAENDRREPVTVEDYKAIVEAQEYKIHSLKETLIETMAKFYVSNRAIRKIFTILAEKYSDDR